MTWKKVEPLNLTCEAGEQDSICAYTPSEKNVLILSMQHGSYEQIKVQLSIEQVQELSEYIQEVEYEMMQRHIGMLIGIPTEQENPPVFD
jgi:hypothetical protein